MAILDTTNTFVDGEQITSTKLNNIIDQAVFKTGNQEAVDGTTLLVDAGGYLKVGTVQTGNIATGAVTTVKIADANVTPAKLSNSDFGDFTVSSGVATIDNSAITTAKIADDAVTTAKILNANVTPAKLAQPLTLGTSQASTSGTSIDFTNIPSWVNRVTITLFGISTNGSSRKTIQLGTSSGFVTTGYLGSMSEIAGSGAGGTALAGSGLAIRQTGNTDVIHGTATWNKTTGNTWIGNLMVGFSAGSTSTMCFSSGSIALASALTQVRITTENGTDAFDAGSINIMYE
jgi:hypothetical protein